jgi:hypothetical protein
VKVSGRSRAARARRPALALAVAVAVAVGSGALVSGPVEVAAAPLSHPAPIQPRDATTMTADALPTAQIDNGVAWTVKVIAATVYAGGSFTNARPAGAAPGTGLRPRHNLMAFDLATGALTPFAPWINGTVRALAASPDGSRLYVGGTFTSVNGQPRTNIAAFSTATGALLDMFTPTASGTGVFAIAATDTTVYVGGELRAANGVARRNLAAFSADGALLSWAPTTDWRVEAMLVNPSGSKVIIGGRFYAVNGVVQRGMAALSPRDGSLRPWAATRVIKNGWDRAPYANRAGIWSLSTDGVSVFGTAWVWGNRIAGNLEGAFSLNPETGAINWIEDCHGDSYGTYSDRTYVYVAGHPHDCESVGGFPQKNYGPTNMRYALAFTAAVKGTLWRTPRLDDVLYTNWAGRPAPAMVGWFPSFRSGTYTGQGQAVWAMTGAGDYLVAGGEFTSVNGRTQSGLVRFGRPAVQGASQGPLLQGADWVPQLRSLGSGTVRVSIPGNVDPDDLSLTYTVTRSDAGLPVHTTTFASTFWNQSMLGFLDAGLDPGSTYTYRVTATDGDGNTASSGPASITVPGGTAPPYPNRVLRDRARLYWRLGSADGGSTDVVAFNSGVAGTGVTDSPTPAPGSGTGYRLSRAGGGVVSGSVSQLSPEEFSAEVWFRTTTRRGGRLFGFGTDPARSSRPDDRHVYLSRTGRLVFGIRQNNALKVVTTSRSYRDGKWHHVVATLSSAGAALYVDGALRRSNVRMFKAEGYYGYWRLGGDVAAGWPRRVASNSFSGDLDEFAVYPVPLTAAQVKSHYTR